MNRGEKQMGVGFPAGKPASCTHSSPPREAGILGTGCAVAQKPC